MTNAVAQVIGFIGTGIFVASFQCKSARKLLWAQVLSCLIYIVHFALIGAYAGAVIEISLIANYVTVNISADRTNSILAWRGWKWVYSTCFVVSTLLAWQGAADLLPCVGSIVSTLAGWTRNGKKIRISRLIVTSPCWLIYDILMHSYSGITAQVIGLLSVLVSVWRYGWKALDQQN